MRTLLGLALLAAVPAQALADSSTRIRLQGEIPLVCNLISDASPAAVKSGPVWSGQAAYTCNAPHLVALDLGLEFAGATVVFDGVRQTADTSGVARIYRSTPYSGSALILVEHAPDSGLPQIRLSLQTT